MNINPYTLSLPKNYEQEFLNKYFFESLWQFRFAFFMVTLLYGLFGFLDTIIVPEFREVFFVIRFAIVIPLMVLVLVVSFFSF